MNTANGISKKNINILNVSTDLQIQLLEIFVKNMDCDSGDHYDVIDIRKKLLDEILQKVEALLNTSACSIYIKQTSELARMLVARGYQKSDVDTATCSIIPPKQVKSAPNKGEELGITSWIISTGRSFLATNHEELIAHPHWSGMLSEPYIHVGTFLGIPIRGAHNQIIGALKIERAEIKDTDTSRNISAFNIHDQIMLQELGEVAGRCLTFIEDIELSNSVDSVITSWALKIFSDASTTEDELDSFLDIVVRVAAAATQSDACSIFLVDKSKRTLTQRAGSGHQGLKNTIRSYKLPEKNQLEECGQVEYCSPATCSNRQKMMTSEYSPVGITAWVAGTGKSFYANNKEELRNHCHHLGKHDPQNFNLKQNNFEEECSAWFGVPLIVGGSVIGVLKIENKTKKGTHDSRQFSTEVKQRFEVLAQNIGISIERLKYQTENRYEVINKAMPTVFRILQGDLEILDLVTQVVNETAKLFEARACALFIKEGNKLIQPSWAAVGYASQSGVENNTYESREYSLVSPEDILDNPSPEDKVGLTVWIAVKGLPYTARSNEELRLHPHHKGTYDKYNFGSQEQCESFMGIPLLVGEVGQKEELIGVLKVETKQRIYSDRIDFSYFNEQDELVFQLIAKSTAIAIQNARLMAARRLADQLLMAKSRYDTFSVAFRFINRKIDVLNTLDGALTHVANKDSHKEIYLRIFSGILRSDFNVFLLEQLIRNLRDSKTCASFTTVLRICDAMLKVNSWKDILNLDLAEKTGAFLSDKDFILFDFSNLLLETHKQVCEYLKGYDKNRDNIVELENCKSIICPDGETAKKIKEMNSFEKNIFERIITHWYKLIERELSDFHIIPNFYQAGIPLPADSPVFFGREDVFNWIESNLYDQKAVLIIHGGWHTGKTSILKQLEAGSNGSNLRNRGQIIPVFIDMQALGSQDLCSLFYFFSRQIYEKLLKYDIELPNVGKTDFEKRPYLDFGDFLRDAIKAIHGKGKKSLLLMIDEFEKMDEMVIESHLDKAVFPYFRSIMQHEEGVSFLLAGRHQLKEMTPEFQNMIFNISQHIEVDYLDEKDAKKLITEPVYRYNVTFSSECISQILRLTAGHPYFIQDICRKCIDCLNNNANGYVVTIDILNSALINVLKFNQILEDLWLHGLDKLDRRIISALGMRIDNSSNNEDWVPVSILSKDTDIEENEIEKSLDKPLLKKMINRKITKDAITMYSFGVELLHLWINRGS